MSDDTNKDKEQFTKQEEIVVKETPPLTQPTQILTTHQRKTPIKRHLITYGTENYGMTTNTGRFGSE